MRVVVILGRVLDPRGMVVNRRRGRIFVNRETYVLQPADRCALEAALRIKDERDVEVVALPRELLPEDADPADGAADVLRQALAAGADRAVHPVGRIANPSYGDALMAQVLAAMIGRLGDVDLILTGATTLDTGQGQLGPRLAEALGWPQVVDAWAVRTMGDRLEAVRRVPLREGAREDASYVILEADLPAVVTFHAGALKPRYPDGVRLINVYRDQEAVEAWDATDLVGEEALQPLLEKRGREFPPERELGTRLSGAAEEMARSLVDALRERMQI